MTTQPPDARPPTDYRALRRRRERELAIAVVVALIGVGGILIAVIFGRGQALGGLACLGAGAGLFGLLWLVLTLMERWAGRSD